MSRPSATGGAHERARVGAVVLGLVALFAPCAMMASCNSSSGLVDRGAECSLATDCAPGLVCVEQKNKTRVCSDDLTDVAGSTPPREGQDAAARDAPPPNMDSAAPETGPPEEDAEPPPPMDASQE